MVERFSVPSHRRLSAGVATPALNWESPYVRRGSGWSFDRVCTPQSDTSFIQEEFIHAMTIEARPPCFSSAFIGKSKTDTASRI